MKRLGLATFAALILLTQAEAQDITFAGKTINIMINFPAGGSPDILMRAFIPALEAKIPGNPKLVIENRPGAGGLVGANYFYNQVKPDGQTIGFFAGITAPGVVGLPVVKYDPTKMRWLAALPQTQIIVARNDLGIKKAEDIARPANPIIYALTAPNAPGAVLTTLFFKMADVPHKFVSGYHGQDETVLALARGEVNATDVGITTFLTKANELRSGKLFSGILQRGVLKSDGTLARDRLLPEIPTIAEVIRSLHPDQLDSSEFNAYRIVAGTLNVQFGFVLPPGADDRLVNTLRNAVVAALASPEAKAAAIKTSNFDYDYIDGESAERELSDLKTQLNNPAVHDLLFRMMSVN